MKEYLHFYYSSLTVSYVKQIMDSKWNLEIYWVKLKALILIIDSFEWA